MKSIISTEITQESNLNILKNRNTIATKFKGEQLHQNTGEKVWWESLNKLILNSNFT